MTDILDESLSSFKYERRVLLFKRFLIFAAFVGVAGITVFSFFQYKLNQRTKQNILMGDLLLKAFHEGNNECLDQIISDGFGGVKDIAILQKAKNNEGLNYDDLLEITSSFIDAKNKKIDSNSKVLKGNMCIIQALGLMSNNNAQEALRILSKVATDSHSDVVRLEAKILLANIDENKDK